MSRSFLLVLSLQLAALASNAAQFSPEYESCRARAAQNTVQLNVCDQAELGKQDTRLNKVYKQLMAKLSNNAVAKTQLRDEERVWLKKRDADCKTGTSSVNNKCLLEQTVDRATTLEGQLTAGPVKGPLPKEIWGTWVIERDIPTATISCWGQKEADALLGTKLEYAAHSFQWKNVRLENATASQTTVTAAQFEEDHSGGGANDSRVTFAQLGIKALSAAEITIFHKDVPPIGPATSELPGESVLLKDANTLVFSVCNLYFEARRTASH